MDHVTIEGLKKGIKRANRNAAQQLRRLVNSEGTGRDIRVRPQFWEQVARDYAAILKRVDPDNTGKLRCGCGSSSYYLAPIVGARCSDCFKPL